MAEVELGKRRELLDIADSRARRTGRTSTASSVRPNEGRLSRQDRLRIVEQALV